MSFSKIILIIFVVSVCAEDYNYQDRYIYKSEFLNVCTGGAQDLLDMRITFEDQPPISKVISGQSKCEEHQILKILSLKLGFLAFFTDEDRQAFFAFKQESINKKFEGVVYAIIQRLSVQRVIIKNKEDYDCVVQGDGTILQYGPFESFPAPKIYVHCKKKETEAII